MDSGRWDAILKGVLRERLTEMGTFKKLSKKAMQVLGGVFQVERTTNSAQKKQ